MGNPSHPNPVKLIASVISQDKDVVCKVLEKLVSLFSPLDFVSETMPFDFTDYYKEEMGETLWRKIVGFERLISPESISAIKCLTNDIETSLSAGCKRRMVNIDPGYINRHHLILATTKPGPHRPYLKEGMYADLTLVYQEKTFKSLPWTYPDYRSDILIAIINGLRKKYLFHLKQLRKGAV